MDLFVSSHMIRSGHDNQHPFSSLRYRARGRGQVSRPGSAAGHRPAHRPPRGVRWSPTPRGPTSPLCAAASAPGANARPTHGSGEHHPGDAEVSGYIAGGVNRGVCGRAAPPRRPLVSPLALDRYEIRFTVSAKTCEKLRLAQDMLRHAVPTGDPAEIVDRALTVLLEDLARKKFAATKRPRPGPWHCARLTGPCREASPRSVAPGRRSLCLQKYGRAPLQRARLRGSR
jgi:hypothetical protein